MHNIFMQELRMFMDEQEGKKRKPNYNNKTYQSSSSNKYEENKASSLSSWDYLKNSLSSSTFNKPA